MSITEQQIATSVLVIGTGGGGLRAAIELAEQVVEVLALGKRPRSDAHTSLAAGVAPRGRIHLLQRAARPLLQEVTRYGLDRRVGAHRWACTRRNWSRSPTCSALTSWTSWRESRGTLPKTTWCL